jgi:class 3 adenylate cyclase/tetratricopeptide (TPR) repeat protein/DNA polymerase III delta prime subunit
MTCTHCGHDNPDDANFCGQCGAPLTDDAACATCGRHNPAGARFCRGCGASLQGDHPVLPAEDGDIEGAPVRVGGGRYAVQRYLGEGGRKRVYVARDTMLDRDVALAIVKTTGLDEMGRLRVHREAQAMARLGDHPHIVTVHDIGEERGEPYIVSQYMAGGALETLLEEAPGRRLDLSTALEVADGVCQALEHAHRHGIVHRDLKPANVFLTEEGTAKLGDFGLAFSLERSRVTQAGVIVGTVSYMAPEQALGHQPGPAADLYSLGAMLYEMVAGRPPFVGDDVVSVISQHQNAEPVAPSWHDAYVPKELEDVILELLAKSPEERPDAPATREKLAAVDPNPPSDVLVAPSRARGESPLEALAGGVFVGREREVDRLRTALEESLAGRGKLILLVGEPGIGKTRTAQELATYARLRGARVLIGRSYEAEGAPAYWPWLQMARTYIQDADPEALATDMGPGANDIAQVIAEVRERIPTVAPALELEPEQARFRFFDSISTFLKNAALRDPLVLFLDDLHWADGPSLRLLQFLARELSDSKLLVVGTYRDVELGRQHPLSQALADLSREGLVDRISMRGLSEAEVERFVEVTASIKPPHSLVKAIYEETEGNPFFMSEIVSLLASEVTLDDPAELARWTVTIPQGVREVVGRRLDRLSEECNRVLAIASVIGREFGLEVLERVAELPRDRLLALLEEADGQRIVSAAAEPGPMLRFAFSHALVREALYEELGVTQRVRLHHRIAEVIEEICGEDREPHLSELAHHFLQAQELERAIDYSSAAADRAAGLMAYEEAAELYGSALGALELKTPTPARRHCELLVALGGAQTRTGDGVAASDSYRRAARLARELDERDLFAHAAVGLAGWFEVGAIDTELIELLEEAIERLGEDDAAMRARLLVRLAMAVYFVSADRRIQLAHEAVDTARRVGDPLTLAFVLNDAHFVLWGPESGVDRVSIATELIELAERAGDHELAVEGRGMRLVDLLEAGDIEAVDREMSVYERGAMSLRQPNYKRYALIRRGMRSLLAGRFDEVATVLEKVSPEAARHQLEPNTLQAFGVVTFALRRLQGDLSEVEAAFREFVDQYPAVPAWRAGLAVLHTDLGNRERARREFERLAEDDFAVIPVDANWIVAMALMAEVCGYLRDSVRAAWLYEHLTPYAARNIIVGGGWTCYGSTERFLGILAAAMGDLDLADRHLAEAERRNIALGSPPLVAITRFDHARVLLERDREGDAEQANKLLGEVLETAGRLGMKGLVQRAFEQRLQLQGIDSADVRSSIDAVASVVEEERPDLRGHTAPDGTVTILFSDIERSTELNERLGDRAFIHLLREHNQIIRDQVRAHGGFEVKSQGDGFMIAFSSARRGVECAIAIQRRLAARIDQGAAEPIRVRMGLHTGEAIRERDDFFGRNVVLAARIAAQADGGEILVSSLLRDLTESAGDVAFGESRELDLKGLSGTHTVHAVEWEPAGAAAGS